MLANSVPWDVAPHCWDEIADDAMRSIYRAYERPLGVGASPAVLAIDLYQAVFAGGSLPPEQLQADHPGSCGRNAHQALGPITDVLSMARAGGLPVLHLTASRAKSSASPTNRRRSAQGPQAWDFQPDCAPLPGEVVIEKERASAFYGTQLVSELVRLSVDTVIIVGETTSGCVRASAVDAYSNGFHVVVVEDGVFDRSWLNHCVNLFDLHHKYADVVTAATLRGLLSDDAVVAP